MSSFSHFTHTKSLRQNFFPRSSLLSPPQGDFRHSSPLHASPFSGLSLKIQRFNLPRCYLQVSGLSSRAFQWRILDPNTLNFLYLILTQLRLTKVKKSLVHSSVYSLNDSLSKFEEAFPNLLHLEAYTYPSKYNSEKVGLFARLFGITRP